MHSKMHKTQYLIFLLMDICICQVVFDDDGSNTSQQQSRPFSQQQGGFNGNPNGFGQQGQNFRGNQNNGNFGFGNPNQQQGFGNPNNNNNNNFNSNQPDFQNGNNNNQQFQQLQNPQEPSARQPDCQTFQNNGGFCTPLTNCDRIGRMLRNRPPLTAARILRRSLCGFEGFLPNVCCPIPRSQFQDNSLGNGNNNNGNNGNFGNNNNGNNNGFGGGTFTPPPPQTQAPFTGFTQPFPITAKPFIPSTTNNPFGSGPVTLIPPKTTTTGGGGGLIIIGGGSANPTPPSQSPGLSDEGLPQDCGFSNASHTRIVGGRLAEKGAWPWIAALGYKDESGNVNYLCGGALIAKNFILTANHCVYKRKDLVSVRLGDHDIFSDADGVTPLNMEVAEIIENPNYDPATFHNDIALLRLKESVPFTRQVHPICLPSTPRLRSERFEDNTPFVAGWGAIQFNGPSSSVLREVQVPIVQDSVCQEKFKSFKSVNVDDTNICAGFQAGGKDACQGDSGGPLMQPVGANRYVIIGVVSFGFKCAEPGYPGVYSRVTSHLDWITKTIQGTS